MNRARLNKILAINVAIWMPLAPALQAAQIIGPAGGTIALPYTPVSTQFFHNFQFLTQSQASSPAFSELSSLGRLQRLDADSQLHREVLGALAAHLPDDYMHRLELAIQGKATPQTEINYLMMEAARAYHLAAPEAEAAVVAHSKQILDDFSNGAIDIAVLRQAAADLEPLSIYGRRISNRLVPLQKLARDEQNRRTVASARKMAASLAGQIDPLPTQRVPPKGYSPNLKPNAAQLQRKRPSEINPLIWEGYRNIHYTFSPKALSENPAALSGRDDIDASPAENIVFNLWTFLERLPKEYRAILEHIGVEFHFNKNKRWVAFEHYYKRRIDLHVDYWNSFNEFTEILQSRMTAAAVLAEEVRHYLAAHLGFDASTEWRRATWLDLQTPNLKREQLMASADSFSGLSDKTHINQRGLSWRPSEMLIEILRIQDVLREKLGNEETVAEQLKEAFPNTYGLAKQFEDRLRIEAQRINSPSEPVDLNGLARNILPENRAKWAALKDGDSVHVYALLDSSNVNEAMRRALADGVSEKVLYEKGSPIHKLALKTLAPVKKKAKLLEKEGLQWASNYNFSASGSTLLVEFVGSKSQVVQSLDKVKVSKVWFGDDTESLLGNHLLMRDEGAYQNAVTGVSTVYLRRGVDKGYKVGPGQIDLKGSDEVLPVYFEAVEEIPYSKVGADILNGLAAGLTWKEMFSTMQSYYPGFTADDLVTVIRYRRR